MNMLSDLVGFVKRNSRNWNDHQIKKSLKEAREIVNYLEKLESGRAS